MSKTGDWGEVECSGGAINVPRTNASKLELAKITIEKVRSGEVGANDLTIKRDTLLEQAALAERQGYPQLARNLRRAAELTAIPDEVLLEIYEKLRPYRATYYQLLSTSQEIAARYNATETGEYIREAAEAYRAKGLLKQGEL